MSLINKMLQDLDARRSDVSGSDAYGGQIRAVPERRGIHAAWWVALVLAILLAGVLVWVMLRPAPVVPEGPRPQLPLKLDTDLAMAQPPVPAAADVSASAPPILHVVPATEDAAAPAAGHDATASLIASEKPVPKELGPQTTAPKTVAMSEQNAASPVKPARTKEAAATSSGVPIATEPVVPVVASKQIKELTPQQRAENEYRKAVALMQQGRSTEAVGGLEQALQLDARHAAARQTLIGLLLETDRREDAMRRAREGLNLDVAQPGLAMILARLQLEKEELRAAIETLERSAPHATDRADYAAFLAALLQRDGRHKEAARQYLLALNKAPQNSLWWMGLGISLQADNRLAEAQEAFSRAKANGGLSPELLAFVESKLKQLQR